MRLSVDPHLQFAATGDAQPDRQLLRIQLQREGDASGDASGGSTLLVAVRLRGAGCCPSCMKDTSIDHVQLLTTPSTHGASHSTEAETELTTPPSTFTTPALPAESLESLWAALTRSHKERKGLKVREVREVRLLRLSWVVKQAKAERPLPRRQDIERETPQAFLDVDELRRLPTAPQGQPPLLVVSYAWERSDHPDPEGATLRKLCNGLKSARMKNFPEEAGVFVDWCSLCQRDRQGRRTKAEESAFRGALGSMHLFYAHPLTTVALMTETTETARRQHGLIPYADRGWPTFESHVAVLVKRASADWDTCFEVGAEDGQARKRSPPLTPEGFD